MIGRACALGGGVVGRVDGVRTLCGSRSAERPSENTREPSKAEGHAEGTHAHRARDTLSRLTTTSGGHMPAESRVQTET